MAPNTATMKVASRLRVNVMVPTEMPSWWRSTEFCTTTCVRPGIAPKPSPITTSRTSNQIRFRLSTFQASTRTAQIAT